MESLFQHFQKSLFYQVVLINIIFSLYILLGGLAFHKIERPYLIEECKKLAAEKYIGTTKNWLCRAKCQNCTVEEGQCLLNNDVVKDVDNAIVFTERELRKLGGDCFLSGEEEKLDLAGLSFQEWSQIHHVAKLLDKFGASVQPIRMHVNDASYCRTTWKNDLREQVVPTLIKYYNFKHTELREKFRPNAAAMDKKERMEQRKVSKGKTSLLKSFKSLIRNKTVLDVIGGKIKREEFIQDFYDDDSNICTEIDELNYCTKFDESKMPKDWSKWKQNGDFDADDDSVHSRVTHSTVQGSARYQKYQNVTTYNYTIPTSLDRLQ